MTRLAVLVLVLGLWLAAPAGAVLAVGSHGGAVRAVQQRLGLPADGVYGRATARAVRRFQRRHALRVTGRVNAATRSALRRRSTPAATGTGGAAGPTTVDTHRNDTLVDAVLLAVGRPYAAGAAGPRSFDCSGLVVWAAARVGLDLPRSSFAQFERGVAVARADLAPGDLVFFDTNGPGASDVGVVVGPDSAVSATTHGVRRHTISGAYWGKHYVGARRFR